MTNKQMIIMNHSQLSHMILTSQVGIKWWISEDYAPNGHGGTVKVWVKVGSNEDYYPS